MGSREPVGAVRRPCPPCQGQRRFRAN